MDKQVGGIRKLEKSEKCGATYVGSEVPTAVTLKNATAKVVTMHNVTFKSTILNIFIIRTYY